MSSVEDVFPEEEVEKLGQEIEKEIIEFNKYNDEGGDHIASMGTYPTRKGVILVTKESSVNKCQ